MKKPVFLYTPETHQYFLDNVEIPGPSKILQSLGFYNYDQIKPEILRQKADIGKSIHAAIEMYNRGKLDEGSLVNEDMDIRGYMESWKRFVFKYNPVPILSEKPICSYIHRFGCTPDLVCRLDKCKGKYAVVEYKTTTAMSPAIAMQTTAQMIAASECLGKKINLRYGIQLKIDGSEPHIIPYHEKDGKYLRGNDSDIRSFLCLLHTYNLKMLYGIKPLYAEF